MEKYKEVKIDDLEQLVQGIHSLIGVYENTAFRISFPFELSPLIHGPRIASWLFGVNSKICFDFINIGRKEPSLKVGVQSQEDNVVLIGAGKVLYPFCRVIKPDERDYWDPSVLGTFYGSDHWLKGAELLNGNQYLFPGKLVQFGSDFQIIGYYNDQVKELLRFRLEQSEHLVSTYRKFYEMH